MHVCIFEKDAIIIGLRMFFLLILLQQLACKNYTDLKIVHWCLSVSTCYVHELYMKTITMCVGCTLYTKTSERYIVATNIFKFLEKIKPILIVFDCMSHQII